MSESQYLNVISDLEDKLLDSLEELSLFEQAVQALYTFIQTLEEILNDPRVFVGVN